MSHGAVNTRVPTGLNRSPQPAGSATTSTFVAFDRLFQRRVGVGGDHLEDREEGQRRDQAAGQDDRLAADLVGQRAEHDEEAGAEQQRPGDQQVGGVAVDLEDRLQEEQRVELAGVPDHGLARHAAEQRQDDDLDVASSWPKASVSGAFELLPSSFIFWKTGDSFRRSRIQTEMPSSEDRDQERNAPAPGGEVGFAERGAGDQDHEQRQEQAERRRGLDPRGVGAALALRRVLGDVGRRAAVLAAERQALQQAQRDQDDRRGDADGAQLGSRPTMKVDRPMIRMVTRKVYLRPTMSPRRPNTSAPNGRTRKPAAKASSAKMSRVAVGSGREELRADDARRASRRDRSRTTRRRCRATRRRMTKRSSFVIPPALRGCRSHCGHFRSLPKSVDASPPVAELGWIELWASPQGNIPVKPAPIRLSALCTVACARAAPCKARL